MSLFSNELLVELNKRNQQNQLESSRHFLDSTDLEPAVACCVSSAVVVYHSTELITTTTTSRFCVEVSDASHLYYTIGPSGSPLAAIGNEIENETHILRVLLLELNEARLLVKGRMEGRRNCEGKEAALKVVYMLKLRHNNNNNNNIKNNNRDRKKHDKKKGRNGNRKRLLE